MPTNAVALTRLLLNERPSLLRLAQRIVGTAPAAEDVTQSLWLRIQRVEDDPPIIHKRAYLYRLATNLAVDHARSDQRREDVHAAAQDLLWGSDPSLQPDRIVDSLHTLRRVEAAAETFPEHQLSLWADYRFAIGLKLGAGARYTGSTRGYGESAPVKVPGYTLFDAMIGYDFGLWRLAINARNLTNKYYFGSNCDAYGCGAGETRRVVGTLTYRW